MLKNYLKIAFRNLLKHKVYSLINIWGLAVGIACCLLIFLFINDELSYDRFNNNADCIYRVNSDIKLGGNVLHLPMSSDMVGPMMKKDYPQVEEFTRIIRGDIKLIRRGNEFINEPGNAYADSTFFKVFTLPALYGDTRTALNEPNSVVITESTAKKYFGAVNVVGRIIETNNDTKNTYKITAVIKDMPQNSHFKFDFIFPIENASYRWGDYLGPNLFTYLVLKKGTDYKEFEGKLDQYVIDYILPIFKQALHVQSMKDFEKAGNRVKLSLTPLVDIHLYSNRSFELSTNGNIQYVYIFSAIALFILLIACVNFMNLTTAHAFNRAKEVGIRKVLGTERKNLIYQFLFESVLMTLLASFLAVFIVDTALPLLNSITGKEFNSYSLFSYSVLVMLFLVSNIIGLIAGSYPAFYLSRFSPEEILKRKNYNGGKSKGFRGFLVVFQFVTSIVLITGTIIIYKQLNYIQNKDLGYQKDQVLVINDSNVLGANIDAFKIQMLRIPGVMNGTVTGFIPSASNWRNSMSFFKEATLDLKNIFTMQNWPVDYDYIKTMGMKLQEGRDFSKEFGTDSTAVILNEAAVKLLGFSNPVGQKIYSPALRPGKLTPLNVIGVVKNFNYESLHQEVAPLCLTLGRHTFTSSFKVSAANIPGILKQAKVIWKNMAPGMPFKYGFMDESFNETYKNEENVGITALTFTILAIFIACLGLFGLAAFMAEQRTKEIGIRKVLGASVPSILMMLSKEFMKWIIIANVIAWPVAYYFMNKWLQDFAYRINISIWVFVLSGVTAVVIAIATISFQAVKAATSDPVKSLKYE